MLEETSFAIVRLRFENIVSDLFRPLEGEKEKRMHELTRQRSKQNLLPVNINIFLRTARAANTHSIAGYRWRTTRDCDGDTLPIRAREAGEKEPRERSVRGGFRGSPKVERRVHVRRRRRHSRVALVRDSCNSTTRCEAAFIGGFPVYSCSPTPDAYSPDLQLRSPMRLV